MSQIGGMKMNTVLNKLKKANDFLKKTQLISKSAHALSRADIPYAQHIGRFANVSGSMGYGRKRKTAVRRTTTRKRITRQRRMQGKGFMDVIKKINNFLKKTKLVSTVGSALGNVIPIAGTIGRVAGSAGYGRRKKRAPKKKLMSSRRGGALSLPGGRLRRTPRMY